MDPIEPVFSASLNPLPNHPLEAADSTSVHGKSYAYAASSQPSCILDREIQSRIEEVCEKYVWPDSVTDLEPYMSPEAFNEFKIICLLNSARGTVTKEKTDDVGNETLGASGAQAPVDDVIVEPKLRSMREQLPPYLQVALIRYRFKTELEIGALQNDIYADQYSIHHGISPFGFALKNIDKDPSFKDLAISLLPHINTITPTDLTNLENNIKSLSWLLSLTSIPEKLFFQKVQSVFKQHMNSRSLFVAEVNHGRNIYTSIYNAFHAYAMRYSSSQLTLLHLSDKGFQKVIRGMDKYERTYSYTPSSLIQSLDTKSMFGPNKITAMGHFCAQNDLSMVQELHQKGLSLTYGPPTGRPPLYHAVAEGHVEIVDYLLNNGACDDVAELMVLIEIANQGPQNLSDTIKYYVGTYDIHGRSEQTIQRLEAHREVLSKPQ